MRRKWNGREWAKRKIVAYWGIFTFLHCEIFFCLGLGDGDMATEGASRLIAKPDKQNAGRRSGTARYGQ